MKVWIIKMMNEIIQLSANFTMKYYTETEERERERIIEDVCERELLN